MLPFTVLDRLAARAAVVFAAPSATSASPPLSTSARDFPHLVSCTRALVLLAKPSTQSRSSAHLQRCLLACAEHTLDSLQRRLPPSAEVSPDVAVTLFGVLRASVDFWEGGESALLAQQLSARVDAVVLRTWRPRVLLAAVHAIAKACPDQAALPLVDDVLALLHHHEPQLTERDVATLLWCMATLHVGEREPAMWTALCRRATLLFPRMNRVSRMTVSQALLLEQTNVGEAQAELLRVVHEANREQERDIAESRHGGQDLAQPSQHPQRWSAKGSNARFYAEHNAHGRNRAAPSQLTAQLLQSTTHSLSDEALVRLLLTLFTGTADASEELLLVLAHLGQRTTLSARLCVQVLNFAQQHTTPIDGDASGEIGASTMDSFGRLAPLMWQARRHVTQLLVRAVTSGASSGSCEIVEALCVEHHYLRHLASATSSPSSSPLKGAESQRTTCSGGSRSGEALDSSAASRTLFGAVPTAVVWDAVVAAVASSLDKQSATSLHSLGGAELWRWHCVRAYITAVQALPVDVAGRAQTSPSLREIDLSRLARLDLYVDVQRGWPNARERLAQCTALILAAAGGSSTALLTCVDASYGATARQLLETSVQETRANVHALPVAATLRLLAATDTATPVAAWMTPLLSSLQVPLLTQLETHTSRTSGALPEMIRYLSSTLVRDGGARDFSFNGALHYHHHNNSCHMSSDGNHRSRSAAGASASFPLRVPDAVLDVYVRLLVQEQQEALSTVQVQLLVRCLLERQRQPIALEHAFMMLLTRRLGQSASLLQSTTVPLEAMCRLVELATGLPRVQGSATATATRTLIVSSLLDLLVRRSVPACTSPEGLVAACLLMRLDVVAEFQRAQELAAALDQRGTELLLLSSSSQAVQWTPERKAYLIAALVCAQREPSEALLRALHGESTAQLPASSMEKRNHNTQ